MFFRPSLIFVLAAGWFGDSYSPFFGKQCVAASKKEFANAQILHSGFLAAMRKSFIGKKHLFFQSLRDSIEEPTAHQRNFNPATRIQRSSPN
jgi:hypothetical protein